MDTDELPAGRQFAMGCYFQDLGLVCCAVALPLLVASIVTGTAQGTGLGAFGSIALGLGWLECWRARDRLETPDEVPNVCRHRV